ncbi:VOC family protein [Microbacterium halophytorum]|uniref:VOC family protein n=1 Tax=Microbacterium halophytorum TaxID=2067568 RepID=UPI000CFB7CC2|nr:VOC family protein [Microbacterium halophytorum]
MAMQATPYLTFDGNAEEAMKFYQAALGGQLDIVRIKDMPMEGGDDEWSPEDVMHSALVVDGVSVVYGSDGGDASSSGGSVTVCLSGDDADELAAAFEKLSDGADVTAPFGPAPWGGFYGQFTDRFGVPWMLEGGGEQPA